MNQKRSFERILHVQALLERKVSLELALASQNLERLAVEVEARGVAASYAAAYGAAVSTVAAFSSGQVMARRELALSKSDSLQKHIVRLRRQQEFLQQKIGALADQDKRQSDECGVLEFVQRGFWVHPDASSVSDD